MKRFESYSALLSTTGVILALLWTVGKPHAEDFIDQTVDGRISAIEKQLDTLESQLTQQRVANEVLRSDTSTLKEQGRQTQQGIQQLLEAIKPSN